MIYMVKSFSRVDEQRQVFFCTYICVCLYIRIRIYVHTYFYVSHTHTHTHP